MSIILIEPPYKNVTVRLDLPFPLLASLILDRTVCEQLVRRVLRCIVRVVLPSPFSDKLLRVKNRFLAWRYCRNSDAPGGRVAHWLYYFKGLFVHDFKDVHVIFV